MFLKNILASLLSRLLAQKLPTILMLLGSILSSATLWYQASLAKFLADPTGKIALLTTTLSIVLLLLIVATYFWFNPKFIFDKRRQIYIDVKTSIPYCPSCKDGYKRLAKLIKHESCWQCSIKECRMIYDDPDYIHPQKDKTKRTSAYG